MGKKGRKLLLFTLLVSAGITAFLYRDLIDRRSIVHWVSMSADIGPLVFILIYAVATVLFIPGTYISFTGGFLFGPVYGTLYNAIGATLGSMLAFLIGRYFSSEYIRSKADGRAMRFLATVDSEGWRIIALARLVPLFPFNLINYLFGLTSIAFMPYMLTTIICILPACFVYTYLGYAGREVYLYGGQRIQTVFFALSLIAALILLPGMIYRSRRNRQS